MRRSQRTQSRHGEHGDIEIKEFSSLSVLSDASARSVTLRYRLLLVAILLLAFGLRVVALDDAPPGLRYDENLSHVMAERVLAGERPLYFAESWGREALHFYVMAGSLALFGQSDWALRLPSPFFGLFGVLGAWLVARRLFGRRVGWITAVLLAVSFWAIFYARIGSRVGTTTAFLSFALLAIWLSVENGRSARTRWLAAIVAGLLLGVNMYVYVAGRVGFVVLAGFALYLLLLRRDWLRRAWPQLVTTAVIGLAVYFPLYSFLAQNPEQEQRLDLLAAPLNALREGDPRPVLDLTARAWGMYVVQGEQDWLYNVYGRPIFSPILATFFVIGVGWAIWRWRESRHVLLLGWLVAGTLPAMLAPPAASLSHTIAAQPAALLLLAVGMTVTARWLTQQGRAPMGQALVGGLLVGYGVTSGLAYFGEWRNAPEVRELYQGGITAVADDFSARQPTGGVAVGAPFVDYWQPWNAISFDLAVSEPIGQVRWFNPAGGWVWPAAEETLYYFPTDPLGAQAVAPAWEQLFLQDAQPLAMQDDDFIAFRVDNFAAAAAWLTAVSNQTTLAFPPDVTAQPPEEIIFGEAIWLQGAQVTQPVVQPNETFTFLTTWQMESPFPYPLVAFVHLTSDGVDIWAQQDWLDVRVATLQVGDRFVQQHTLTVKPDAPAGLYQLQVGLYRPDTGERLHVALPDEQMADRVWVGEVTIGE